jgi:hypothetical protein
VGPRAGMDDVKRNAFLKENVNARTKIRNFKFKFGRREQKYSDKNEHVQ